MVHRLVLNLRAYSRNETTMPSGSKSDLTFRVAYGGSLPHSEVASSLPVRSTIASFMAIEEIGGLLGAPEGDEGDDYDEREGGIPD